MDRKSQQNLEFYFEPLEERPIKEQFELVFKDSNKKVVITCIGKGIIPKLTFDPIEISFQPCLPDQALIKFLKITNNTEMDIRLVSPELSIDIDREVQAISKLKSERINKRLL